MDFIKAKDNEFDLNNLFNCKDKLYNADYPLIMGVVNITPDSFYSVSRKFIAKEALIHVEKMIESGAEIIDVGGISTRPNADLLTAKEEIDRIIPIIYTVKKNFPQIILSVDTFRADVAKTAVENGADIVNDVYGGNEDDKMFDVVAQLNTPYILMHSRGNSKNMQQLCDYEDVVKEVIFELSIKINKLRDKGVNDIIIDPGFGFAKTLEQNYELMNGLNHFKVLNCPVLIGISRKSMIYKLFNNTPENALSGTVILNTLAVLKNADIIRVHDVEEAAQIKKIIKMVTL